jgi:hypothetical protein
MASAVEPRNQTDEAQQEKSQADPLSASQQICPTLLRTYNNSSPSSSAIATPLCLTGLAWVWTWTKTPVRRYRVS